MDISTWKRQRKRKEVCHSRRRDNWYKKWFREDQHIFLTICSDGGKASQEVLSQCKVRVFRIDKNLEKNEICTCSG